VHTGNDVIGVNVGLHLVSRQACFTAQGRRPP
jgi:hypothetical protein